MGKAFFFDIENGQVFLDICYSFTQGKEELGDEEAF
jgi:hypothetical protein